MRAKRQKPVDVQCLKCDRTFLKKFSEIVKSPSRFCSRSCAASYNNSISAKKSLSGECKQCGVTLSRRYIYCAECRQLREFQNKSIADVICKSNKASKYCRIREHARRLYQHITGCEVCGYDKHVEICHIKPLSSFELTVLVFEANKRANIAVLCPNCHWELDNGLLKLKIGSAGVEPAWGEL